MSTAHSLTNQVLIIESDEITLWTESFGSPQNPPLILIMGSGGQGVLWPVEFCEQLAAKGYFVVRYDNRDTGLSTEFNYFTHPYNLLDMAKDVVRIQDAYQFKNSHIVGASMGGAIAMILAANFPERVKSLTLMITTIDMRPCMDAFQGLPIQHILPAPDQKLLAAVREFIHFMPKTEEDKIEFFIKSAEMNCGSIPPDKDLCRELAITTFKRKHPDNALNHIQAIANSHPLLAAAPSCITVPTQIIHGAEDPLFPIPHGEAIHAAIENSSLHIMPGMGHSLAIRAFFKPVIELVDGCAKKVD